MNKETDFTSLDICMAYLSSARQKDYLSLIFETVFQSERLVKIHNHQLVLNVIIIIMYERQCGIIKNIVKLTWYLSNSNFVGLPFFSVAFLAQTKTISFVKNSSNDLAFMVENRTSFELQISMAAVIYYHQVTRLLVCLILFKTMNTKSN